MVGESSGRYDPVVFVDGVAARMKQKLDMLTMLLGGCAQTLLGHSGLVSNQERLLGDSLELFPAWSRIIILDEEAFVLAKTLFADLCLTVVRFDGESWSVFLDFRVV